MKLKKSKHMEAKETSNQKSSYEGTNASAASEKTPEQKKVEKMESVDKELKSFDEKVKSPEEVEALKLERSQEYQQKLGELEKVLGPLGSGSKELIHNGLVHDVIDQAHKDNERYDELKQEKSRLEGGGESKEELGDAERLQNFFDEFNDSDFKKVSDEQLTKMIREANDLSRVAFDDDKQYSEWKNKFETEMKKSPYITSESLQAAENLAKTSKGRLETYMKTLNTELFDMRKAASNKDEDLEIKTYKEEAEAKKEAGVKDRYAMLGDNLEMAEETGDKKLAENIKKELDAERKNIIDDFKKKFSDNLRDGYEKYDYYKVIPIKKDIYAVMMPGLATKDGKMVGYSWQFFDSKEKAEKIKDGESKEASKQEQPQRNENRNESQEKEKLFKQQVENNAHPLVNSLKTDLPLFFDSTRKEGMDLQSYKDELDEILYRTLGIEHSQYKKFAVSKADEAIFSPLIKFREELENWNSFSHVKREDFEKRFLAYLGETFGIEIIEPIKGKVLSGKTERAVKTGETGDRSLNNTIRKVIRPGFKISDELLAYHKEWLAKESQRFNKTLNEIKGNVSQEEFDRRYESGRKKLESYRLPVTVRPADVEIYKFNG